MERDRSTRLKEILRILAALLAAGLVYYAFVSVTGSYVPCFFRLVTGRQCPGCGVSHLFTALMRGDITTAFYSNPFVFVLLLPAAIYAAWKAVRYVRTGEKGFSIWEDRAFVLIAAAAVVFGIARNL